MPKKREGRKASDERSWLRRQFSTRPKPAWIHVVGHLLVLGIMLLLYALPHHVLPRAQQDTGIVSSRADARRAHDEAPAAAEPVAVNADLFSGEEDFEEDGAPSDEDASTPDASAEPSPMASPEITPQPTEEPVGSFRNRFADKFTDGEVIKTNSSYRSANLNVTFRKKYFDELASRVYFVDIYVADITYLRTALAKDTYGRGIREWITRVTERVNSVAAMNGDYYSSRDIGVVVRNGKLYRDRKNTREVAVLYWDGRFEIIPPESFDAETVMANGAYQCWHFGPGLLDDEGHAKTKFNADREMLKIHPRSAFGYFEPGHYCFVVVDGRREDSQGVKIEKLSLLMEGLGCTAAYNLDGGQTSLLAKGNELINRPSGGGKTTSDYIVVIDGGLN